MEQLHIVVEAVVMAFMIGGIVGAIVALNLRSGKALTGENAGITPDAIPVKTRDPRSRRTPCSPACCISSRIAWPARASAFPLGKAPSSTLPTRSAGYYDVSTAGVRSASSSEAAETASEGSCACTITCGICSRTACCMRDAGPDHERRLVPARTGEATSSQ